METKKIVIACFVGGALCVAVALMCAPMSPVFWCLGLLAGMAGGYLSYEFREVLRAIPIAWRKTVKRMTVTLDWLKKPHPFFWPFLLVFVLVALFGLNLVLKSKDVTLLLLFPLTTGIYLAYISYLILSFLAIVGSSKHKFGKNCYWAKDKSGKKQGSGDVCIKLTYRNIYELMLRGLWICIYFVFWGMWILAPRFGWHLFKLIRSKKRVLCAIDGTIGGTIVFFCFASASLTFPQQILVVFFGGLLGAVIGVLDYKIISKQVLHLVPVANNI